MNTKSFSRLLLTVFIASSAFATKAQNLIPNPSFENANCPTGYNGAPSQVTMYMQDWYSANCASPDVMTDCSVNTGQAVNTSIPTVWFGYQYAHTGSNYMGLGFYGGWYEYIGVKLTQPLVAGTQYNVKFFASCANDAKYATDALGIYFSTTEIKCVSGFSGPVLTYTPQIIPPAGSFLTDTLGWTEVSGTFTAGGGEEYIVVGYFNPWNIASFQTMSGSAGRCYYYVDDFSVEAILPAPAQPGTISGLQSVCEGSTQTFSVDAVSGATSYTWTLPNGWTGASTTNSITVAVGTDAGNVSVTANNASGSSLAQTSAITVNTFPAQPGTVSGPLNVCTGANINYSVTPVAGATSYFWTIPSGWSGASASTDINITVGNTGGMLIAHAQNECGTSGSQIDITVQNPNANVTLNGTQLVATTAQDSYQWVDCNANNATIPGATQSSFTPTITGIYAVIVTKNGCAATSTCLNVTIQTSSIEEHHSGISIFPNPVKQFIQVVIENQTNNTLHFILTDLSGKIVHAGQSYISQSSSIINIPDNISNGIYLLEMKNGENTYFEKIVIEK